ncbi:Domain of uncharacterised function (DUF1887) [Canicola haemoglobinophilus]|uniref:Domain of uncharacterized function (DUF1887) n=1 Tax=Canicola haemoglobinophilus TaxID=733 RepID=A0AB38H768_9PAST|nr:DUF1887 family CARF protein [Canicola haemoglobinophilus]STO53524.1 Domain of uncharacterised function (DUF1887) [Canicola haemoglobinophilus]STO68058.1 Domain of uncharacterised function (DUF1887) [Canicola haemoglobinophilus]
MQKYDVHFCLVSAQAAPNFFPIFDKQFKPQEVVLFISNKMKSKAEHLEKLFLSKNIKVKKVDLNDVFDFSNMENEFIEQLEQYEDRNIALNATGGTKLMAMAAQNAFVLAGKPIFYIDTDENRIVFITKDEQRNTIPDQTMDINISVSDYLSGYGATVLNSSDPRDNRQWMDVAQELLIYRQKYQEMIPLLNKYVSKSENYHLNINKELYDHDLNSFLIELAKRKMIDYDGKLVDFQNNQISHFLSGGWLEDFTYWKIKDLSQIQDISCNLEVANDKYNPNKARQATDNIGNNNEFDIVFLAKNKLHIIECKTQFMKKEDGEEKAENILYKLETLKDYGGLMTKKCLVSYFEVPKSIRNRAKTLNVELIQASDLFNLKNKIQDWIAK